VVRVAEYSYPYITVSSETTGFPFRRLLRLARITAEVFLPPRHGELSKTAFVTSSKPADRRGPELGPRYRRDRRPAGQSGNTVGGSLSIARIMNCKGSARNWRNLTYVMKEPAARTQDFMTGSSSVASILQCCYELWQTRRPEALRVACKSISIKRQRMQVNCMAQKGSNHGSKQIWARVPFPQRVKLHERQAHYAPTSSSEVKNA
jgi:hypothetical protein